VVVLVALPEPESGRLDKDTLVVMAHRTTLQPHFKVGEEEVPVDRMAQD